jgi:hypothetical protein
MKHEVARGPAVAQCGPNAPSVLYSTSPQQHQQQTATSNRRNGAAAVRAGHLLRWVAPLFVFVFKFRGDQLRDQRGQAGKPGKRKRAYPLSLIAYRLSCLDAKTRTRNYGL